VADGEAHDLVCCSVGRDSRGILAALGSPFDNLPLLNPTGAIFQQFLPTIAVALHNVCEETMLEPRQMIDNPPERAYKDGTIQAPR
jgi:hypothetical protein